MAIKATVVAVSTTPTIALDADESSDGLKGSVTNLGATTVYVGGPDLTHLNVATNGYPLVQNQVLAVELELGEQLFVVTASGTSSLQTFGNRF